MITNRRTWAAWAFFLGCLAAIFGALSGANAVVKWLIKEVISLPLPDDLVKWRWGTFAVLMVGGIWFGKQYAEFIFKKKFPSSERAALELQHACLRFLTFVGKSLAAFLKAFPSLASYVLVASVFMSRFWAYAGPAFITVCYFISQLGVARHNGAHEVRGLFDSVKNFLLGISSFIGGMGSVGLVAFSVVLLETMIRYQTLTPQVDYTEFGNTITSAVAFAFSILIGSVQGAAYAALQGFAGFAHPVFSNMGSIGGLAFFKAFSAVLGAGNAIASWTNIPTTLWSVIGFCLATLVGTGLLTSQQWDYLRYQFNLILGTQEEVQPLLRGADAITFHSAFSSTSSLSTKSVGYDPDIESSNGEDVDDEMDEYQESWCSFFARKVKEPIAWVRSCCNSAGHSQSVQYAPMP